MKVHFADNIKFLSNFYHVRNIERNSIIDKIITDNIENLGKEPILITDKETIAMDYDGKHYTAKLKYPAEQYKIYYKDTDKYENNGIPIPLDSSKLSRDIFVKDLINSGKPLQKNLSKGTAEGKVIKNINNIPNNEPVILVLGDVGEGEILNNLPTNVKGIIVSDGDIYHLSHIASLSRSYYDLFTILYDEKIYNKLLKLNNKYISISNIDGDLKYEKIDKPKYSTEKNNIRIPVITENEDLLNYSQLNPSNAGNKAYRIALMQTLKYDGVLKNIEIPRGFFIPNGYIKNVEEFINSAKNQSENQEMLFENHFIKELEHKCENMGIDPKHTIMRSAFNAEDLYEYPSAGLYSSELCYDSDEFVITIDNIIKSKDSEAAVESRKRYNIPDNAIQPAILLQEHIDADYTFTAYSDLDNNKVHIELGARKYPRIKAEPAKIIYNSMTEDADIVEHQVMKNEFLVDNEGNIIEKKDGENPILENWNILAPLIGIIGKNALTLEKILSKRQDVEGGIKDGKVYFWQARDIVKKALKRL